MNAQDTINLQRDFDTVASLFKAKYGVSLMLTYDESEAPSVPATLSKPSFDEINARVAEAVTQKMRTTSQADLYVQAMAPTLQYDKAKGIVGSIFALPGKRSNYIVTEINARAPKYCVHVEVQGSGARYKMSLASLSSASYKGHI